MSAVPAPAAWRAAPISSPARLGCALLSVGCALLGAWLAWHYPLGGSIACGVFIAVAAASAAWPTAWIIALPALLPLLGFYPWTGWLTVEEFDLVVLAVAAGGYLRACLSQIGHAGAANVVRTAGWLLIAGALCASMWRGIEDAGGMQWSWWQGYHEPLNAVRLAKSFFLASLLWPLWSMQTRARPDAARRLGIGLAAGLAAASLAAVWERVAFTDLLDFSTDYRTTAFFWEMHVGGAALDGFLAFSFPFAVHRLLGARGPAQWLAAAIAVLIGSYAGMTTFSRAVYLAIPTGIAVLAVLRSRQSSAASATNAASIASGKRAWVSGTLLMAVFASGALWMFPSSGYRGLLALLGTLALLLPLANATPSMRPVDWCVASLIGAVGAALAWAASSVVDKGAYLTFAVAWVLTIVSVWRLRQTPSGPARAMALVGAAGFLTTLASMVLVAAHWGGPSAESRAWPVALLLLVTLALAGTRRAALWPPSWRWQASFLSAAAGVGMLVAAFTGGSYMTGRFATGEEDGLGRVQHWEQGIAELRGTADWILGKGMGRFAAITSLSGDPDEATGDYRLETTDRGPRLVLTGGRHLLGWGELLRVSQRISVPESPVGLAFEARVTQPVKLDVEVCEKHLLYNANCATGAVMLSPGATPWQPGRVELSGARLGRGKAFAPRLIAFSMSVGSQSGKVELGELHLVDATGRELLSNGDFEGGLAHWFFSSDRYHLPWHIKNMEAHLLFEQGLAGLALFALLVLAALWRVSFGSARTHELSPALAASLIGAVVVGLTDSLLDMPRIAFLFYLLSMISLSLPGETRATPERAAPVDPRVSSR